MKKQKSPPCNGRLGKVACVNKQRLAKELSDFQAGVKSKEEVEATVGVLLESMRRQNLRWK